MVKRRSYYYRRRRAFYRNVANYHFKKFSIAYRLAYDTSGAKIIEVNNPTVSLAIALQNCPDFKSSQKIFHSYKIKGVRIEASPQFPNDNTVSTGLVAFGFQTGSDGDNFEDVVESDRAIILSPVSTVSKYISLSGGNGFIGADVLNSNDGKFTVKTNMNAQSGGQMWGVRLTFYVLLKGPN